MADERSQVTSRLLAVVGALLTFVLLVVVLSLAVRTESTPVRLLLMLGAAVLAVALLATIAAARGQRRPDEPV